LRKPDVVSRLFVTVTVWPRFHSTSDQLDRWASRISISLASFILRETNVKTSSLQRDSWSRCGAFALCFAARSQLTGADAIAMILCDQLNA